MGSDTNQPLQAWTCIKCGAALPAEVGPSKLVTCKHCGTLFKLPATKARTGGINISGGPVTIGGDLVGGSKIVTGSNDARSIVTLWDDSTDIEDKGISINGEDVQIRGDVIGGNVIRVGPAKPKLSWWEKIKRLFSR